MDDRLSGTLVRIFSTHSLTEGYLARGRLESDGIPVVLKGEGEGPYRMGPVHLWVPVELEIQARLILEEIGRGSVRVHDDEDLLEGTNWDEAETAPPSE
ncbi:MAG: DUF2007 domain-containing protein [Actinomycetota bacterium]|nr:DUF2007 domain-containing protein [Actinomycetota bacterium]